MTNYQIKFVLRPELVLRSRSYPKSKVTHCSRISPQKRSQLETVGLIYTHILASLFYGGGLSDILHCGGLAPYPANWDA